MWGGVRPEATGMTMMMNVEERIRFLLRTAIRAEGAGELKIAALFRERFAPVRGWLTLPMRRPCFCWEPGVCP